MIETHINEKDAKSQARRGELVLELACDFRPLTSDSRLSSSDRLILLTHYSPRFVGTQQVENDCDGGGIWYDCVHSVVEELEPVAIVQGHNHRWFGSTYEVQLANRKCLILNPGPSGCVFAVDTDSGSARSKI